MTALEKTRQWAKKNKAELVATGVIATTAFVGGYIGWLIGYSSGYEDGGKAGAKAMAEIIPRIVDECRRASIGSLRDMGAHGLDFKNLSTFTTLYYADPRVNNAITKAYQIMEAKKFQ